ncbi:ATP synthase subunit I [Roseibacterium sp. SDUM158017]|uniref:N-ATPase subunit AtpR n=1 Tax=Roseicyclus salinarum TaxID=3036773 RepID=UPI0024150C5D|nr:ATP synthase subunit I [Roseibacterium sp. SDUM158017]MDG4649742.1 ATP synthase subunit I [Roseibacterium sp. SDUM158017]
MTEIATWGLCFAAGAAFGAAYLALLWAGARQIAGPRPVLAFAGLAAARAALVAGALTGAASLGAGAAMVLSGLAGFVAVRIAATRRAGDRGDATWR